MSSKFRGILDSAKGREPEPEPEPAEAVIPPRAPVAPPSPAPAEVPEKRGPGRPRGKRSDKEGYVQATAYLKAETRQRVREALVLERKGREFSELVEELLTAWLNNRTAE